MAVRMPWARRHIPWVGCVVTLGLGLRLYHYARDPSMWHDEAALVLNVLGKSFPELLGPLFFAEAAPPLFLWVEKAIAVLLGDGTYALRLLPFLASCTSMVLMVPVARRALPPPVVPWALLLFACSDHLLWHACEAKPYAVDVLAATTLLAVHGSTRSWPFERRLIFYGAFAPLLIFLAYPGCFLCGGLLVALLPTAWRADRLRDRIGYGLIVLLVLGTFGLLLAGPVLAQRCQTLDQCWEGAFPPWDRPWTVPVWTLASTLDMVRYCCGPTGQILAIAAAAGAILLWHRRKRTWVLLLVLPILLGLAAACLRAYPYGGARVLAYATPALVLLVAEGVTPLLAPTKAQQLAGALPMACVRACTIALLLVPLGQALYRVAIPWPRADCAGASAYVLAHRQPGERVAANHWEYAYYFRHLGGAFTLLEEAPPALDKRLWLVATAGNLDDRLRVARDLAPGDWRTVARHEFDRTSVFLLSRRYGGVGTGGQRSTGHFGAREGSRRPLRGPRTVLAAGRR